MTPGQPEGNGTGAWGLEPAEVARLDLAEIARALAAHQPVTWPSESSERRAAVAVILAERAQSAGRARVEALFIKRAEHPLDPWSGHVAFPGGHQDPEDESLEAAARRETLEEIGLRLDAGDLIGRLDDIHGGRLGFRGLTVSPFVYRAPAALELTLSDEVARAFWTPVGYLADPGNVRPYIYPPDPVRRKFPSYQYLDFTIWGITYRMIGSMMRLFGIEIPGEGELTDVE